MASRFNLLSPRRLVANALDPATRPVAAIQLREGLRGAWTLTATLGLLNLIPGVEVGWNPFSSEFGKVRVGSTRYDLTGGESYTVRYLAQLARAIYLDEQGAEPGVGRSPEELTARYLRSQLSPSAAVAVDWQSGRTFDYKPFTYSGAAADLGVPFIIADAYKGWKTGGAVGAAKTLPSLVGVGVQTYTRKAPRRASQPESNAFGKGGARSGGGGDRCARAAGSAAGAVSLAAARRGFLLLLRLRPDRSSAHRSAPGASMCQARSEDEAVSEAKCSRERQRAEKSRTPPAHKGHSPQDV